MDIIEEERYNNQIETDTTNVSNDKISSFSAAVNVFKGSIGTGILGLPYSVKNCGILIGTISLTMLGIVTIYCMNLLVVSSRYLSSKYDKKTCDYGDVAEYSMVPYGKRIASFSRVLTECFIIFTQMGFLCVYVVFIWATIDHHLPELDKRMIFVMIFIVLICISFSSNLVIIGYFSTVASVIQCTCLTLLFGYLILHFNGGQNLKLVGDYRTLPLFFGTAMFAFEGIAVILPVENKMKRPEKFFCVVDFSMGCVCLLYITSGFLGYAAFGENVRGSVTLNLPHSMLNNAIEFGYVIAIILSYPIQFYVPMEIMDKYLSKVASGTKLRVTLMFIRFLIVLFTCVAAVLIPHLENLLSLSGAFAAASISLVFPSLFHYFCFKSVENVSKAVIFLDIFIAIIGLIGSVLGTYSSTVALLA